MCRGLADFLARGHGEFYRGVPDGFCDSKQRLFRIARICKRIAINNNEIRIHAWNKHSGLAR